MKNWKSKFKDLEGEMRLKILENERLNKEMISFSANLTELSRLIENTPSDCKRGEWCKSCEFGKKYVTYDPNLGPFPNETYICAKGESCNNFIPRSTK